MPTVCVSLGSAFTRIAIASGTNSKPRVVADHDGRHDLPTCISLLMPVLDDCDDGNSPQEQSNAAEAEALVAVKLTSTGPNTIICDSFVQDWINQTEQQQQQQGQQDGQICKIPSAEKLLGMYLRKCQEIWQSYAKAIPSTLVLVLPSLGMDSDAKQQELESRMRQLVMQELGIQHGVNSVVHVMDASMACCAMALPMLKQSTTNTDCASFDSSDFVLVQADWNGCSVGLWTASQDSQGSPCVICPSSGQTKTFLPSVSLAALSASMTSLVKAQAEKKFGCALGGRAMGKISNAVSYVLPSLLAGSSGSSSSSAAVGPTSPLSPTGAANSVSVCVESLYDGMDYSCAIGRARLEDMVDWDALVKAILSMANKASSSSSSSAADAMTVTVFLTGDFANFLARRLSSSVSAGSGSTGSVACSVSLLGVSSGTPLNCAAQEVSAIGGAMIVSSQGKSSSSTTDGFYGMLSSKSLLLQWQGQQEMSTVIPRNQVLPCTKSFKPSSSNGNGQWKLFEAQGEAEGSSVVLIAEGQLDGSSGIELTLSGDGELSIKEVEQTA